MLYINSDNFYYSNLKNVINKHLVLITLNNSASLAEL